MMMEIWKTKGESKVSMMMEIWKTKGESKVNVLMELKERGK